MQLSVKGRNAVQTDWRVFRDPLVLLNLLEEQIKANEVYKDMYERRNRCITIYYKDDFYMDILPACPDAEAGGTCIRVPDRKAREWKASNPKGLAALFESSALVTSRVVKRYVEPVPTQEDAHEKPPLKLAVQLIKRRRDVIFFDNCDNAPISVVLTTLAAQHYGQEQSVNLALTGILSGIATSIHQLPAGQRLHVFNPSNPQEDLSERWDNNPEAWRAFVRFITTFQREWEKLNRQQGIEAITTTLKQLFGDEPVNTVVKERASEMQAKRDAGQLSIKRSSGMIVGAGTLNSVQIPRNTFYGK